MRNLLMYPLTADEAAAIAEATAQDFEAEERIGDMRPLALKKAARFILANQEAFEEFARIKVEDIRHDPDPDQVGSEEYGDG